MQMRTLISWKRLGGYSKTVCILKVFIFNLSPVTGLHSIDWLIDPAFFQKLVLISWDVFVFGMGMQIVTIRYWKVTIFLLLHYRPLDLDLVLQYLEEEIILTFRVVRHQ